MKSLLRIILMSVLVVLPIALKAQTNQFLSVSGTVLDGGQKLPYVSVTIKGSAFGTITNEDGYFNLKIPNTDKDLTIIFTHVGYYTNNYTVKAGEASDMRILLKPFPIQLDPALIVSYDPEELLRAALKQRRYNYSNDPVLQRGFYRETARKGNRYISISEAVTDMFKYGYDHSVNFDRAKVLKARSLMSQKASDTLAIKLIGGPLLPLSLDVVKNDEALFYEDDLPLYHYSMGVPTVIEQRPVLVVNMTPNVSGGRYPLFYAKVYIDRENLAIMRVEYSADMRDPDIVSRALVVKKPAGLKFQAKELSFIASYRYFEGKPALNYVRSNMAFRCDWRKRLFKSDYAVVTEMVVTDMTTDNPSPIPIKEAFKGSDSFTDRVEDFADPDFWGDYNILEPSESLENAVDKLRRRVSHQ